MSPIYGIWKGVRNRCNNPRSQDFPRYGGRGIKLCIRWEDFTAFEADMGPTYQEGLTIERKNFNGDYCPENCTWIPLGHQGRNSSQTKWIILDGERMCLAEAARKRGLDPRVVRFRLYRGWSEDAALTTPTGTPHLPHQFVIDGKTLNIAQAAKAYGLRPGLVSDRIKQGWDIMKALTEPIKKGPHAPRIDS